MRLKLMQFNLQDFFLRLGFPLDPHDLIGLNEAEWQLLGNGDVPNKPLAKLRAIARVIADEGPDVLLLAEVGGRQALVDFVRLFLDGAYDVFFESGNSNRGIESAYLVRRCLPVIAEIRSHRHMPVVFQYPHEADPVGLAPTAELAAALPLDPPGKRRLSRDIPELRLFHAVDGKRAKQPFLAVLLAHLKSGYDPDGIDPGGAARRGGEAEALHRLLDATRQELAPVPVIVAGDLNATAARRGTAEEMQWIYAATDLEDALEIAGTDPLDRISHITYYGAEGSASQYDYILLPKALHPRVQKALTYVHRFRYAEDAVVIQMPGSMRQRWELPSDHYPVVCTLDLLV